MAAPPATPPSRFSTLEVDLALIGGQDVQTTRALSWPDFVRHWSGQLERLPDQPRWNSETQRLGWGPAWRAPPGWSTATWPDFARDLEHDQHLARPVTLLHMALYDAMRGRPGAMDAFRFLLDAGVSSNVWPGHGATVISQACLMGHLPSMAAMIEHDHDFQATLGPDAVTREEFRQSSLLHRVGPALAERAIPKPLTRAGSRPAGKPDKRAVRSARALEFLVRHVPDPDARNAAGHSALELVCQANPDLADTWRAIWNARRAALLAAQWGAQAGALPATLAQAQRQWVGKKGGVVDATGAPLLLRPADISSTPPALPLRVAADPAPGTGVVVLRATTLHRTPGPVSATQALELARHHQVEAVVSGRGPDRVWWAFHPRQLRPAVIAPALPEEPAPRPRM